MADDYTTHIKHSSVDPNLINKSWCGKRVRYSFAFGSVDHAAYHAMMDNRLIPCGECVRAVMESLQRQLSVDTKRQAAAILNFNLETGDIVKTSDGERYVCMRVSKKDDDRG